MNRGVVRYVVDTCQECIMEFALGKNINDKNGISSPIPICNGLLAPASCSMVTQVPNSACIWFDKSGKVILLVWTVSLKSFDKKLYDNYQLN